jgi:hypothetical protein
MTVVETMKAIRALGLTVRRSDGEWNINYRGGRPATAYFTTDNDDALAIARAMIAGRERPHGGDDHPRRR